MFRSICAAALLSLGAAPAGAVIISTTPTVVDGGSAAGLDLRRGATENPAPVGYDELQGIEVDSGQVQVDFLLGANLALGDTLTGFPLSVGPEAGLFLPFGLYDSHYISFDPPPGASGTFSDAAAPASFTFDGDIVAIITSNDGFGAADDRQSASDDEFGNAAFYPNGVSRRLEGSGDIITLSAVDTISINLLTVVGTNIDAFRVITQSVDGAEVPLPATAFGLLAALALLSSKRRRAAV
ncbi:MAG: hypothetical protein AAGE90_05645 [Pseudomonadota bacterium]